MTSTYEEPTKPTRLRRRRSAFRRLFERPLRWLRYVTDADYARRHDAGKKAGVTRKARRSMAVGGNASAHHPECGWSFTIVTLDGDFEKATWTCVTECLAIGSPPNKPQPSARRWRATAPEDARSQETT